MKQLSLTLPLPNSANTHWRHGRGITYLSKQGRDYRELVANAVQDANVKPMTGRLSMHIELHFRDKRKTDIDNRAKSLCDALQHAGAFVDDSQIDELHVYRKEIISGGQCQVVIREINNEA